VRHSSEAHDSLRNMLSGCERGRDVARSILAFSRREDSARELVDLREVVSESTRLLRAALPSTIELSLDAPRVPCSVEADPGQFQRVVTNLVTNAAHALDGRPGTVRIALAARTQGLGANSSLPPGNFVELSVTDTGCGMDEATRRRIFEPFFTTKGPQKGTGLGLSVVHGIVTAHGGSIEVESAPGAGTTVRICLPASAARSEPAAPIAAARTAQSSDGGGREVLIVDDEEMVGAVLALMLGRLGWIPTVEHDPASALERVAHDPKRFALIVTDRTMPGMNGEELTRELRLVAPELPVILSTGDAEGSDDDSAYAGVLRKPYDLANLAACVDAACGDEHGSPRTGGAAPGSRG
jgi:CheY-like chemotaxis protein